MSLRALALCLAGLLLLACGGEAGAPGQDAGDEPGADAWVPPPDIDIPEGQPTFVLGTHQTNVKEPASFRPLADGDKVEIVKGPQGLFMVVLAFKSYDRLRGELTVTASLDAPEGHVADLSLDEQRTVRASDGWDYYWDFWLVVFGEVWQGRVASLNFLVEDELGERVEVTRQLQLGDGLLPTHDCPEPGPTPTEVVDLCDGGADAPVTLAEGRFEALSVESDRDEVLSVGARSEGGVSLFEVEGEAVSSESWASEAPISHGPWLVEVALEPALVWGAGGDTWLGRKGEAAQLIEPESVPEAAFVAPAGFKVLARREIILELQAFNDDGERYNQHFVNNLGEVDQAWLATEGESVFITYSAPLEGSPIYYQTAKLAGGQCSIPAPLGVSMGDEAEMLAAGVSYGFPLFAWALPPSAECGRRSSRIVAQLPNGGGFEAESWLPLGERAVIVPRGDVAAVVTAFAGETGGFEVGAQFVDLPAKTLGSVGIGLKVADELTPAHWAATRTPKRYAFTWQSADEETLRAVRFCFE